MNVESCHFVIGNFDLFPVGSLIKAGGDSQTGLCCRSADEAEHGGQVAQWRSRPVSADRTEQVMSGRVPFRRATGIVAHRDRQPGLVCQSLQFRFHNRGRQPLLPPLSASISRQL